MFLSTISEGAWQLKTIIGTSVIGVLGFVEMQSIPDQVDGQFQIIQRALREGGFFALVLVLLFFYRRDTKWATEFWKDQAISSAEMIRQNTKAQTELAAAIAQNTVVVHQAKRVLERLRSEEDRG